MAGLEVNIRMTKFFFDRPAVMSALKRSEHRALSKIGAYVRKDARSSLRRRKKTSSPGSPPSVHSNDPYATLKNILFYYEPSASSVIIGPVKCNQKQVNMFGPGTSTVPQIHEYGGSILIQEEAYKSTPTKWFRRDMRRNPKPWKIYRHRRALYPIRPFMHPAFRRSVPKAEAAFKDTFH